MLECHGYHANVYAVAFNIEAGCLAELIGRYPAAQFKANTHIGRWLIELLPHCLRVQGPAGNVDFPWRALHGVETAQDGAVIAAGNLSFWLPRSAFREWTAFERFVSRLIVEMGPREDQERCRRCGYDLRAAPDAGCPECGWRRRSD